MTKLKPKKIENKHNENLKIYKHLNKNQLFDIKCPEHRAYLQKQGFKLYSCGHEIANPAFHKKKSLFYNSTLDPRFTVRKTCKSKWCVMCRPKKERINRAKLRKKIEEIKTLEIETHWYFLTINLPKPEHDFNTKFDENLMIKQMKAISEVGKRLGRHLRVDKNVIFSMRTIETTISSYFKNGVHNSGLNSHIHMLIAIKQPRSTDDMILSKYFFKKLTRIVNNIKKDFDYLENAKLLEPQLRRGNHVGAAHCKYVGDRTNKNIIDYLTKELTQESSKRARKTMNLSYEQLIEKNFKKRFKHQKRRMLQALMLSYKDTKAYYYSKIKTF
jgi:hypothetical protein